MKQLLIIVGLIVAQTMVAQKKEYNYKQAKTLKDDVKIDWGGEFKDVKGTTAVSFEGFINGHGYMLKNRKKDYYLDRLDADMELVGSAELVLQYQKNELTFERIFVFHNKLYLLASFRNKTKQTKFLFAQELDAESMKPVDDFVKISELDYSDGSNRNSGEFFYGYSQDSSLAMVGFDIPGGKSDRERFGIQVFKQNLELDWEAEALLPYKEKDFQIEDYQLDNEGNVYVLGKQLTGDKDKNRVPKANIEVLKYSPESEEPMIIDVEIEGKYVDELYLAFKNDAIVCLGFYANDSKAGAQGCFVQSIDKKTGNVLHQTLQEFAMNFITLNTTDKEARKMEKKADKGKEVGMSNLYIRKVINHKDEQFVVVAEEYFLHVVTTTSQSANGGSTSRTTYYYNYNDIVLFSFDKEFNILWYQKIPKTQVTANDDGFYSSFYVQETDNRLLFVYNDNVKNLHLVQSGKPEAFTGKKKNTIAVAVTVDFEGNVGKKRLFSAKEEEIFLRPKACGSGLKEKMIVFAQIKKNHRYGQVSVLQKI